MEPSPHPPAEFPIEHTAKGQNILLFWLKWTFFTIITLGIAQSWAKAAWLRFGAGHVRIAGHALDFAGTGAEIFKNRMKAFGVFALAMIVLVILSLVLGESGSIAISIVIYLLALAIVPLAIVSGWKWRLSRTSWHSIQLRHTGETAEFVKLWYLDALLVVFTIGLWTPYLLVRSRRFLVGGVRLGNAKASFHGEELEFWKIWIRGALLTILTLGVYGFWAKARAIRWNWEHTRLGGAPFHARHTGGDLFVTFLKAAGATVFTLGLGAAWGLAWMRDWEFGNVSLDGSFDLSRLENVEALREGGIAEELADSLGSANGFDL